MRTCNVMNFDDGREDICTLAEGHSGGHVFIDAMGLCTKDSHCRAQADWHRPYADKQLNNIEHNHPDGV